MLLALFMIRMQSLTTASVEGRNLALDIEDLGRHCSTKCTLVSVDNSGLDPSRVSFLWEDGLRSLLQRQLAMLINPDTWP